MTRELDYLRWMELQEERVRSGNDGFVDVPEVEWLRPMTQQEADEYDRRQAEFDHETEEAQQKWMFGECCGRKQWLTCHGYCELARAPCYADPQGLTAACERWNDIEDDETMSPWTRAIELNRLLGEMEEYVKENSSTGDRETGTQSDGEPLGCGEDFQRAI